MLYPSNISEYYAAPQKQSGGLNWSDLSKQVQDLELGSPVGLVH